MNIKQHFILLVLPTFLNISQQLQPCFLISLKDLLIFVLQFLHFFVQIIGQQFKLIYFFLRFGHFCLFLQKTGFEHQVFLLELESAGLRC